MCRIGKNSISDEMLIAMIMSLDKEQGLKKKEEQGRLISLLKKSDKTYKEARDKDYRVIDEELIETTKNFFEDKNELSVHSRILDDDDLNYFDNIITSKKDV